MASVNQILDDYDVNDVCVEISDNAAFDFAITARVEAAIVQAGGKIY